MENFSASAAHFLGLKKAMQMYLAEEILDETEAISCGMLHECAESTKAAQARALVMARVLSENKDQLWKMTKLQASNSRFCMEAVGHGMCVARGGDMRRFAKKREEARVLQFRTEDGKSGEAVAWVLIESMVGSCSAGRIFVSRVRFKMYAVHYC